MSNNLSVKARRRQGITWGAIIALVLAVALLASTMPVVNARGETFDEDSYYNAEITAELLSDDYPVFDEDTVKDIQRALNKYLSKHLDGFEELSIDGKFGPATAKAVKDYQRLKKMTVDGVVGPATAKALGVSIDQNVFYAPRLADAFERSKNGMAAHLNLRTHLLEIYQMGSYGWELIDIMTCSTGNQKKGYYTPVGIFVLDGESHNVISGDGWEAVDATKIVYIKGEGTFLFHSVLRDPKTGKFDSNSTLGKSITHGCVRLSRENATWVRENLTKGTVVVIDDRNWDNSAMIGQNH